MSYNALEESTDNGTPHLLLEFRNSAIGNVYYTSGSERVTFLGNVYQPMPVKFSNMKATKEVQTSEMTLTLPRNHEFPESLSTPFARSTTNVIIRRRHVTDTVDDFAVVWRGRVTSVSNAEAETEVLCENFKTILKRLGNTAKYQKLCRHSLYSFMCGVSYSATRVLAEVTGVVDYYTYDIPSAAGQTDGYYKGGILERGGVFGYIISHIGSRIVLLSPMDNIVVGNNVYLAPGCDLRISTCRTKFNNKNRHGGFPTTPAASPFGGTNIFSTGG